MEENCNYPSAIQTSNVFYTIFIGNTISYLQVLQYQSYVANTFMSILVNFESRDSSVVIALGYGLEDQGSRVRFPAGPENFPLHHHVQNSSGAHPASYPVGTRGSFPGGKAAGA
jgi:hypothetical protein